MKKTIITVLLTVAVMNTFAQRSKPKVKDTSLKQYSPLISWSGNSWAFSFVKGSTIMLGIKPAPYAIEASQLGSLDNKGHWEIKDTIGLLNALAKDIKIRNQMYQAELRRRAWPYQERELAQKVFYAINERDQKKISLALHNYAQFIRTHQ